VQSGFREGVRRTLGSVQAAAESMSHAALLAWLREQKTRADRGDDEPREEYPDHGPTDPWETSGPGRA
jgi:hypothetical protein